jgi:hypothetical protein
MPRRGTSCLKQAPGRNVPAPSGGLRFLLCSVRIEAKTRGWTYNIVLRTVLHTSGITTHTVSRKSSPSLWYGATGGSRTGPGRVRGTSCRAASPRQPPLPIWYFVLRTYCLLGTYTVLRTWYIVEYLDVLYCPERTPYVCPQMPRPVLLPAIA